MSTESEAFVDEETAVDFGVIDQAFPADGCTWLFEVRPHDDDQIIFVFFLQLEQSVAVVESGDRIVDTAWSDDDEETAVRVCALDDGNTLITTLEDSSFGSGSLGDFVLEEIRWCERVVATDYSQLVSPTSSCRAG